MNLKNEKLELIEMLLSVKEEVIYELKSVLEKKQKNVVLSGENYKELDRRREKHKNGETESFTWQQVKKAARA